MRRLPLRRRPTLLRSHLATTSRRYRRRDRRPVSLPRGGAPSRVATPPPRQSEGKALRRRRRPNGTIRPSWHALSRSESSPPVTIPHRKPTRLVRVRSPRRRRPRRRHARAVPPPRTSEASGRLPRVRARRRHPLPLPRHPSGLPTSTTGGTEPAAPARRPGGRRRRRRRVPGASLGRREGRGAATARGRPPKGAGRRRNLSIITTGAVREDLTTEGGMQGRL